MPSFGPTSTFQDDSTISSSIAIAEDDTGSQCESSSCGNGSDMEGMLDPLSHIPIVHVSKQVQ